MKKIFFKVSDEKYFKTIWFFNSGYGNYITKDKSLF